MLLVFFLLFCKFSPLICHQLWVSALSIINAADCNFNHHRLVPSHSFPNIFPHYSCCYTWCLQYGTGPINFFVSCMTRIVYMKQYAK